MSNSVRCSDPRLYVQIADALRGEIEGGTLKPGDALPSLGKLAESFGVCGSSNQVMVDAVDAENADRKKVADA
jgi:DNA-binding transcriptional regulator YhcF (GntR family)